MAAAVSARLRHSTRTHDDYEVRVAGRGTVTVTPAVARCWVYTTLWRGRRRLHSGMGLTVGLGVQWTPPFLDSSSSDDESEPDGGESEPDSSDNDGGSESELRPGTLQLCSGHRCLVFQIAQAADNADGAAIPAILSRFLDDPRVAFVGYNVRSDCRKLSAHHGLEDRCARELREVTGMGNASMAGMAERLLGWGGVKKDKRVGVSRWHARDLSEEQVFYACHDACLSYCLGARVGVMPDSDPASY
ncbi:uncharacterized protein LOC104584089 [Brachypodium distachyon]|uniref:3'-5' exonuclease domain-containing protein n=1 Tax=Brachypodium distachyon TaxID=15368 RepID=I1I2Q7_BRADI|nr:uncharacterized protein LOC104584089 [Brachypodium distachyon]KQJ96004.1 hypothetical protein BRADI_3g20170v3 [Brachypodium distachyon]|eukprot:XP_010236514.1 uncharacterized protein LOC104584089 [Brachypodium distachyon]